MARTHINRTITDAQGNVQTGASVRLLQAGSTTLISDTIFADDTSSITLSNPFTELTGSINAYLTNPQRVRIGITIPGTSEFFIEDYDVVQVGGTGGSTAATTLTLTDGASIRWSVTVGTDGSLVTTALP